MTFNLGWPKLKNIWQWTVPFCAFCTTFTVVMTILVLSTDFKGHHYMHFNDTNVWEFESFYQGSPELVSLIRKEYLLPPGLLSYPSPSQLKAPISRTLFSIISKKKGGVFIECGGGNRGISSGTEILVNKFEWSGLVTQPHPQDYSNLVGQDRPRTFTSNICISPSTQPKHAQFRISSILTNSTYNSTLTLVPCFPLYSLMLAFNTTSLDLLVLNVLSAEIQILKTIPWNKVLIGVIMILNDEKDSPCCHNHLLDFLKSKGFKQITQCSSYHTDHCFFTCIKSNHNCPL